MKPRLNHQQRKQQKAERKLEAMVKYGTKSEQETKMAITDYTRKYGDNPFIMRLLNDYETGLRSAGA